ncbi:DUF5666 domain-containing protein [candidate division KSB1 bacterium]|nr:DUF5666 domain-containing protein [candidate division KSB1 bacterium]
MKSRLYVFAVLLAAQLLATISSAQAQARAKMTPEEILAAIKPGKWVQLEGVIQRDFSVLCTEAKILTGDFLEDDWSITAVARNIDKARQEFKVLLLPVKTHNNTEYETKVGAFKSFADMKPGIMVEVDGTYLKSDTMLAVEIEDVSSELIAEPGLENQVEAVGKVEKVDISNRTVTLMGITFHIINKTWLKSAIK